MQQCDELEKFQSVLFRLIDAAEECIMSNCAVDGIQYLVEAEKILEYAASCGKNITRNLIMSVLHNEAYGYQRIWELPRCSNYLQALIYNMYSKHCFTEKSRLVQANTSDSEFQNSFSINHNNSKHVTSEMDTKQKMKLSKYLLQYAAVNSQIKNHSKSIESAQKAIKLIKQVLNPISTPKNIFYKKRHFDLIDIIVCSFSIIQIEAKFNFYRSYQRVAHLLKANWEQRMVKYPEDPCGMYFQAFNFLQTFKIGTIMQIKAFSKQELQFQSLRYSNEDYTIQSCQINGLEPSYSKTLQQILYLITSLFTLSTQIRLSALVQQQQNQKLQSSLKQAQIFHLIALIIYYIYIPFKLQFLTHLQTSYTKNYFKNETVLNQSMDEKLTEQDQEILNYYDPKELRYYSYSSQKQLFLHSNTSSKQLTPQISTPIIQNPNIKKLQNKCKRIIGKMYVQNQNQKNKKMLKNSKSSKKNDLKANKTNKSVTTGKRVIDSTWSRSKSKNKKKNKNLERGRSGETLTLRVELKNKDIKRKQKSKTKKVVNEKIGNKSKSKDKKLKKIKNGESKKKLKPPQNNQISDYGF